MAEMIADGMSYLESKSYIHRDLATVHKMLFKVKNFLFKCVCFFANLYSF